MKLFVKSDKYGKKDWANWKSHYEENHQNTEQLKSARIIRVFIWKEEKKKSLHLTQSSVEINW